MNPLFKTLLFLALIGAAAAQINVPPIPGDDGVAGPPGQTTTTTTGRGGSTTTTTSQSTSTTSRATTSTSSTVPTSTSSRPVTTRTTSNNLATTTTSLTPALATDTGVTLVANPTYTPPPFSNTYINTFMPIPPTNALTSDPSAETADNLESGTPAKPSGFLQNKVAMGVTFTFVAIALLAGLVSLSALIMRKRRERRLEEFTNEAGWNPDVRERHTSTFGFNDHDQYNEDFGARRHSSHSIDGSGGSGTHSPTQQPPQSNYRFPPAASQAGIGAYHGHYSDNAYPQPDAARNYSSPYGPVASNATRYPFANQFASSQAGTQQGPALPNHYASYSPSSNTAPNNPGYPRSQELNPVRQPSARKAPQPDYGTAW